MLARRFLGAWGVLLTAAAAGFGQTYPLAESVREGDCIAARIEMKLKGQMRVQKDGKVLTLGQEATGSHQLSERVLALGSGGLPEKSARVYETARAVIAVEGQRTERGLRPDRRLLVAWRHKDQTVVFSPAGALRREELEASDHFDTLNLTGLLPGKAVSPGETWKVPSAVVQALCNYEGLTEQDLQGKLVEVKGRLATLTVTGKAAGIDMGALVKSDIEATARFDLDAKRLVFLEWTQTDERDQGPVSPAASVRTTTTLERKGIEQPPGLSDVALVSVPSDKEPPAPLTHVEYHDALGRFDLTHTRDWQTVAQTKEHLVLRLMDRGDFVAQVTLTPWTEATKGTHLSPEEFKAAMNETPGWEPTQELQAGEVPSGGDRWVYRLSVLGKMEGVNVLQNFYLVAAPSGQQLVLAFTMTPKQAEKLGARDLALVGSLELPTGEKK